MEFELEFESNLFDISMTESGEDSFSAGFGSVVRVGVSDHSQLINRDLENQHPIEAITDLSTTLDSKFSKTNVLTNAQIDAIMAT